MTAVITNGNRDTRLCGARKRQGEGTCRRPAGWGTPHVGIGTCKLHGGCAPNAVKAAARVAANNAVAEYGLPREIDPWLALLEEVHRTAGHVAWLGAQLAQEPHNVLRMGSVWEERYRGERAHLVRVSKAAMECGVAEREVRVAEAQGAQIAAVLRGVLSELGFIDDPRLDEVVGRHLAVIEAQVVEA